jgi:FkbH-like protein
MRLRAHRRRARSATLGIAGVPPTHFLIEAYNPGSLPIDLTITIRHQDERRHLPFQERVSIPHGFTRRTIEIAAIGQRITFADPFVIDLMPNEVSADAPLIFGLLEFVHWREVASVAPVCKCVVWDLDNTMWNGTLIEDGMGKLQLKPGIPELLAELDRRGILLSIASKNNRDDALEVLRHFGLIEYFLHPQVSWDPKSTMLATIAHKLNIAIDSMLFIDDSRFELEEVQAAHPAVKVVDAADYGTLMSRDDCRASVTDESRGRRRLYQEQTQRQEAEQSFEGDYFAFLRQCALELWIRPMTKRTIPRVHELTQRTNQMNFSGRRYSVTELEAVLGDASSDSFVLECSDRFGAYGTIGFGLFDTRTMCLRDLTFSCRVQSKRVEHAFLSFLLRRYLPQASAGVLALYRKTQRNAQAGRVFDDFGFVLVDEADGVRKLLFPSGRPVPNDQLVLVHEGEVEVHS